MIVVIGATFFFAIQLPGESAWSANNTLGPFWPLLTMIQFVVGNFEMEDYPRATSVVFFVIIAFFVTIMMLNLLIAVMQDSYDKIKEQEQIEGLREKGTCHDIAGIWVAFFQGCCGQARPLWLSS